MEAPLVEVPRSSQGLRLNDPRRGYPREITHQRSKPCRAGTTSAALAVPFRIQSQLHVVLGAGLFQDARPISAHGIGRQLQLRTNFAHAMPRSEEPEHLVF